MKNRYMLSALCLALLIQPRMHAAVSVVKVWPDMMAYYPDQKANLRVDLTTDSTTNQTVTLVFDLVSLIDTKQEIARQSVQLTPHQTNSVSFAWNTGKHDYGHAAVVSVLDDSGKVLARKEEAFSITDNLWKVALVSMVSHFQVVYTNFDDSWTGAQLKYRRDGFMQSRSYAANYYEFFGWAPDDFFELAPAESTNDIWRTGTCAYLMTPQYAHNIIRAAHEGGIQAVTYLQPFAMGRRTISEFRKHPDWFLWDEFGQPQIGFTHKQLTWLRTGKVDTYEGPTQSAAPNLANPKVVDIAIDQIVATAKQYHFDGARFDNTCYQVAPGSFDLFGHPNVKDKNEADEKTLYALRRLRERIEKEISPWFCIGHNFAFVVRDLSPKAWDYIASKGWVIVDEMTNRLFAPPTYNPASGRVRPWMDFVKTLQAGRDGAWKQGGHYQMIGFDGDEVKKPNPTDPKKPYVFNSEATQTYMSIVTLASGVHPYSYQYAPGTTRVTDYWKFVIRYSAFIWDNTMKPVATPEKIVSVNAAKDVWWKEFVYLRATEKGEAQTIVHLINPPPHPIHANPNNELPAPIEQIKVQSVVPQGCTLRRVIVLTGDSKTNMTELAATTEGDRASVVIPKLDLWSVVVFDWKTSSREGFLASAPSTATEKVQEDETTKKVWIESTQVKVADAKTWTVEAEAYNTIAEKVADPDAHNGSALRARKGVSKEWYMATGTYSWRERFGKFRLTFRVKCADNTTTNEVISIGLAGEGEGVSRGEYVHRELKGTDFAAPNKYQDFSVDALRSDVGYIGYLMIFKGGADVWVDSITVERTGDTTDQELAEKLGAQKIDAKPLQVSSPRALWVQGLFHENDSFGAALDKLKIPYQVVAVDQAFAGTKLHDFPKKWDEIAQYSILLLSDTDPRGLGFAGRALVKAWVEQGGTLIVTGGPYAFGKGLTKGTLFDEIYPVEITPRWDFTEGGAFTIAKPYPKGVPGYHGRCGSYFVQRTSLKTGAACVLRSKETPVLAYQKVGLGKVIVFTGNSLESDLKVRPFWSDPAWSKWLAEFLRTATK